VIPNNLRPTLIPVNIRWRLFPNGATLTYRMSQEERSISIYVILPTALAPGVYSASNINEYQKQKREFSGE
jgi:hypothetical protein